VVYACVVLPNLYIPTYFILDYKRKVQLELIRTGPGGARTALSSSQNAS